MVGEEEEGDGRESGGRLEDTEREREREKENDAAE